MTKAKAGRPRSEKSQEAVIQAAHALLRETGGAGLTVEAIARRAGVGKATIYRWWPSLADIVLEVGLMVSFDGPGGELPGVVREVMEEHVEVDFNHPLAGRRIVFDVSIIDVRAS